MLRVKIPQYSSSIINPTFSIGLTNNLNVSISQTIGIRTMHFNPKYVGVGEAPINFINDPIIISIFEFFLITTASIFINAAIFLVTAALRMAQKYYSSVFCLVYLQVVWSSLIGIFIFDE